MKKKYLLQETFKGNIYKFSDKTILLKAIDMFIKNGIDVNVRYIRDFDTMTQEGKKLVSTGNTRKSKIM